MSADNHLRFSYTLLYIQRTLQTDHSIDLQRKGVWNKITKNQCLHIIKTIALPNLEETSQILLNGIRPRKTLRTIIHVLRRINHAHYRWFHLLAIEHDL